MEGLTNSTKRMHVEGIGEHLTNLNLLIGLCVRSKNWRERVLIGLPVRSKDSREGVVDLLDGGGGGMRRSVSKSVSPGNTTYWMSL